MELEEFRKFISNTHQVGGIETSVLENGVGKGNKIAWVNTGSGLRFKVNFDRGLDIADAFFNEHSLTWLAHAGVPAPQTLSEIGLNWLKTFGGGLITTCGLQHVGGPESDEKESRGLHGNFSNLPAEIESIVQADPLAGKFEMKIVGLIKESKIFGNSLELRRTITCKLGQSEINISDQITNKGNTPAPVMVLYHINLGYPLAGPGAEIFWEGTWKPRFDSPQIFKAGNNFKACQEPLAAHAGNGEEVAFIDSETDANGYVSCGIKNTKLGLKFNLSFLKSQLPRLTNWQHWGEREYVTALEPGTNWPIGQNQARTDHELTILEPLESKTFELKINITRA
jgi:hypothetical protein